MEYYQQVQNRARQTVALIQTNIASLTVGGMTSADLTSKADNLDTLAAARDERLAEFDQAVNAENQGFRTINRLDLALPQSASGELNDDLPQEAALLSLLDPAYAINPDTTDAAVKRGQKVVAALEKIDLYLAGLSPARPPITSAGQDRAALNAVLAANPALEQAVEDKAAAVQQARTGLRGAARELDRLNKRFYKRLQAEARTLPVLADALGQIETENPNQPATLGIRRILQGGNGGLQLLVSYDNASYDDALENTLEWMVVNVDANFTHTAAVDPSGNALGPFTAGQQVKLRTRTRNANGTTTGSVRTLTIQVPAV